MATTAHDLLHDAGLWHRTYPSWPHAEPAEPSAPSLYLVTTPGLPDALLDPAALAVALASGARPRGLYDVSAPGRKTPLQLCKDPSGWLVVVPGEAGITQPVVLATIKISSEGESR